MFDDKKEVEKWQRGKAYINIIRGKPIIVILIIVAIALGAFLIYVAVNYASQIYKIDYYNEQWNNSLNELRNGTVTVTEYCNKEIHDQELCNQFWNLEYRN